MTAGQKLHRMLHVNMRRQNQNADVGQFAPDDSSDVKTFGGVGWRHTDVDDQQVRILRTDQSKSFGGIACLADDIKPGAPEQARRTTPRPPPSCMCRSTGWRSSRG